MEVFMNANLRLKLFLAATGALVCGIIGAVFGAVAAAGTSVLLPGVGLIVAGPLVGGFIAGVLGVILGALLGLIVAVKIIRTRDDTFS